MKPLTRCANGCDAPPCPPSLVICRACMDAIRAQLQAWVDEASPTPEEK